MIFTMQLSVILSNDNKDNKTVHKINNVETNLNEFNEVDNNNNEVYENIRSLNQKNTIIIKDNYNNHIDN